MSALPKTSDSSVMVDTATVEIPIPTQPSTGISGERTAEKHNKGRSPKRAKTALIPKIGIALRFERAISIAVIVFGLMCLSSISYQSLTSRFDVRDTRASIQNTTSEIGVIREQLQAVKSDPILFSAPEGLLTIPIDPEDVASVTLPGRNR